MFLFTTPHVGWLGVTARPQWTKANRLQEVEAVLERRHAECNEVTVVCDDHNTHTQGISCNGFELARVRELVRRAATREAGEPPIDRGERRERADAPSGGPGRESGRLRQGSGLGPNVNDRQRRVNWPMTVGDTRCTLKAVNPKLVL